MKIRKTIISALALIATAITSSAAALNITVDTNGDFLQNGEEPLGVNSLASNQFYSSFQTPIGSKNNNPEDNFAFLVGVVDNWNTATRDPVLPTPVYSVEAANDDSIKTGDTYKTASGYDYVVFHFGNGPAGDGSIEDETGWWQAWYLGGNSATISLPLEGDPVVTSKNGKEKVGGLEAVGGFSSARYFNATPPTNKVPDSGSTIIALGAGLLGLGGVRRFLIKA